MKKRTCSLLLALAMILSFIPTYATAEDESGAGSPGICWMRTQSIIRTASRPAWAQATAAA